MKPVMSAVDDSFPENGPPATAATMGKISAASERSPMRILVVDDEPLIRWSVSESLSELGMAVQQAGDAASALRTVSTAQPPFDAVVLDLRLPDMEDLSLLSALRQLMPTQTLILMTAFGTPEILADAKLLGAHVINKPFEFQQLHQLVLSPNSR